MPETTTDNKKISLRLATFIGILFFSVSLTFTATKFWAKAEATANTIEKEQEAEKRRLRHLVEKQDYKIKIQFLELQLKECNETK